MPSTKERKKAYYLENRDRQIKKAIAWQRKNRERHLQNIQKFREKNPNYKKEYFLKHPDKKEEQVFKSLMWRLGVDFTLQQFKKMVIKQKSVCAICKKKDETRRLSVDHCHKTYKVRGLLCHKCNTSLGGFKDNIVYLKRAIKYLTKK